MESYNNYQDIINAIKAEYVIVRDLKRVANAKKRELNNAHSFVNRKGNEETTLETRVTNAKQDSFGRANTALGAIKSAIDSDYTLDLNASAAKLAFIEAEILKLQNFNISLPEQFDAFTQNELNSINSLKGVLLSAINDTKFIYENDIIESSKFSALKDETKLSTETSRDNDIQTHYDTIVGNVKQLIDSTRQHFADYVSTSSDMEEGLRMAKDTLVNRTRDLVLAKSELVDLLDSNAPQTQIDAKNVEIDGLKIQAVEKANELKALDIETELFYTNKHKDFSVYFEVIHSLYEEVENWLSDAKANSFVRYNGREYRRDIQTYIRKFMEELITSIGEKIPTANGHSLSQIIRQVFESASYEVMYGNQAIENSHRKNQVLSDLDSFSNYDSETGEFTLSTDVPGEVWSDSFYHLKQLHQRFSSYIDAKKHLQVKTSTFNSRRSIFDEGFNEAFNFYIPAFANAHDASKFRENELYSKVQGIWTGTTEQETTYQDLINQRKGLSTDFSVLGYKKDLAASKLSLYSGMFPSFYSEEVALKSAKESTIATYNSVVATLADMYIAKQAAYDYLQTLTETDEEYQAAFTAWNNAVSEYDSLLAAYDALTPQYDSLVSNLSDITALYGSDAGSKDNSFAHGTRFNGTINSIAIQPDGKTFVGGEFTTYDGTSTNKLVRLNSDGTLDTSFYVQGTGFNGPVKSIAFTDPMMNNGSIVVLGDFTEYNGAVVNGIVKLFTNGKPEDIGSRFADFVTGTGFDFRQQFGTVTVESDGKILIPGGFGSYNGTTVNRIVRLNPDGSRDTSFVVTGSGFNGMVTSIKRFALLSDDRYLVVGHFTSYNGTAVNRIVRLHLDGSIDTSFVTGSGFNYSTYAIDIQPNGKILIGGDFWGYNGTSSNKIIRLNSDGSVDTSFVIDRNISGVRSIAIQSDGKILVGGPSVFRLNSDGSSDTSFIDGIGGMSIKSIAILSDGKIIAAGESMVYVDDEWQYLGYIARINSTTSYNAEFEDEFNEATDALNAFQTDIRIPASNAKNAAEIVVNETYGILQPLTEIDEEYAAAFNDWDSKEIAFGEYDRDFKSPAAFAVDNAIAAYDYHISIQNVYDLASSFSPNGFGLMAIKSEAEGFATQYDDKQSQLSVNQSSLESIKVEMTFVESDLATKLEAYGYIDDENTKAYKAMQYWSSLIESNYTSLTQLSNSIIQSYNQIVDHQSNEEDALQDLKDFTAPEYTVNKDIENHGHSLLFRAEIKGKFSERVLTNMFNLDQYDYSNYFRPDDATTMAFKTNPTFLSDKLRSIAQSYRGRANAGFADQVITFVNTGVSNF